MTTPFRAVAAMAALLVAISATACHTDLFDVRTDDPPENHGLLQVVADPQVTMIADGATVDTLTATLDPNGTPIGTSVTFVSSLGTFLGGTGGTLTVSSDSTRIVRAFLRAGTDTGLAQVTATAAGVTRTISIPIKVANATIVTLFADAPILKAGTSTKLTVNLQRATGTPTAGNYVKLTASGGNGVLSPDRQLASGGSVTSLYASALKDSNAVVTVTAIVSRDSAGASPTGQATAVIRVVP